MNDISNGVKTILKFILKYYLKYIVKIVLSIHKPLIIGISGSTNVTFTRDEIKRQLNAIDCETRSNPKNFNTEIGLPLAILNLPSGYNSFKNWLPIISSAFKSIFNLEFPKILILALGVSRPGDMKYLLSLTKPKIGIITDITQRYIESFDDMDELVGEYESFAKSIDDDGFLILNYDNLRISKLADIKKNKVIFFGLGKAPDQTKDYWQAEVIKETTGGQTIRVTHDGESTDYEISRFGQHHIYALLSALIVKNIISTAR